MCIRDSSTTPGTPNSHVAILARTYGVPFVYLAEEHEVAAAHELAGSEVVLRALSSFINACEVELFATRGLSEPLRGELLELKTAPPLDLAPMAGRGAIFVNVDDASLEDIRFIGGKAANFGQLRRTIPNFSPRARAFTFDLWNAYLDLSLIHI